MLSSFIMMIRKRRLFISNAAFFLSIKREKLANTSLQQHHQLLQMLITWTIRCADLWRQLPPLKSGYIVEHLLFFNTGIALTPCLTCLDTFGHAEVSFLFFHSQMSYF